MERVRIFTASAEWAQAEFDRIQSFYRANRHAANAVRDPEVLLRAIDDNKAYIVEHMNKKMIVCVAFCFSHGDGDYLEFGGTRSILEGYRLQRLLTCVRAIHEFMLDPPTYEAFSIVADANRRSSSNLLASGFEPWQPDRRLLESIGAEPAPGKSFYRLPRAALPELRDRLLDVVESPVLRGRSPLAPIEVDFDLKLIRDGRLTRSTEFGATD